MLNFLKGKKTYIVMVVGIILNGMLAQGIIDPSYLPMINSILGLLGLGALRSGVKASEPK